MAHIFVIAGHGAGDPGAVGNGYTEAERVRVLAKKIKELGGDNVTLGDINRDYYADNGISKLNISKDWQIIELHMDSGHSSARGGHVIINGKYSADAYDNALASFVSAIFPGRANKIVGRTDLANVKRAAAKGYSYRLVEFGFISNATDISIFNSRLDDIAEGVLSAFGIHTKQEKWVKNETGWWYQYADGSYPKSKWLKLDTWYYFDGNGYALQNKWEYIKGHWYYFNSDCRMAKGWKKVDCEWYYLAQSKTGEHTEGSMLDGWQRVKGEWYYLNPQKSDKPHGAMLVGEIKDGDYEYYCRPVSENGHTEGSMLTGWRKLEDGNWKWYNTNLDCQPVGSMMKSHWISRGGSRYYLKEDGVMACNETIALDGKEYVFSETGALEK